MPGRDLSSVEHCERYELASVITIMAKVVGKIVGIMVLWPYAMILASIMTNITSITGISAALERHRRKDELSSSCVGGEKAVEVSV